MILCVQSHIHLVHQRFIFPRSLYTHSVLSLYITAKCPLTLVFKLRIHEELQRLGYNTD